LENSDRRKEVEEHLTDRGEVDGAGHRLDFREVLVVVELPEHEHHEEGNQDCLRGTSIRKSRIAFGVDPGAMEELADLLADGGLKVECIRGLNVRSR
jgi:hypothetical protein